MGQQAHLGSTAHAPASQEREETGGGAVKQQGGGGKSESAQPPGGGEGYAVAALSDARNPLKETLNPQLQTRNLALYTYGTLDKP